LDEREGSSVTSSIIRRLKTVSGISKLIVSVTADPLALAMVMASLKVPEPESAFDVTTILFAVQLTQKQIKGKTKSNFFIFSSAN